MYARCLTWKVITAWFLCLCTFLSVCIISDIKLVARNSEICENELKKVSSDLLTHKKASRRDQISVNAPTIYIITPTYRRLTQKAELIRLMQTLMHVPKLHWIVVEDSNIKSPLVGELLARSGMNFTHLNIATPENFKIKTGQPGWLKPKGVWQRNIGLRWLRENVDLKNNQRGVVYFADDDNTYDLKLFDLMRSTKKVSVWPVGLVGGLKWEGPRIENGKIRDWHVVWKPERPYPIDMAGFAINLQLLLDNSRVEFSDKRQRGYVETSLLEKLVAISQLEPKGDGQIYVWHTRAEKPKLLNDNELLKRDFNPQDFQSDVEV